MKNKIYTIFLLVFSLFLLSTCKNPEIGYETFTITDESIEPEVNGAKVNGSFSFSGNVQEMKMKIATDESLTNATNYSLTIDNQAFSGEIDGLEPNTTYYYCYNIDFGWKDDYLTETNSFTTLKGLPTVKTLETIALYDASFRIKCEVTSDGGSDIMERGIYWCIGNTDDNHPNLSDNKIIHDENEVGEYFCLMDNLEPNTTYSVKAYAKNSIGISLAQEVLHFKTHDNPCDSLMIVTDCNPTSGGIATGGGAFTSGQRCTVTATANEGYAFTQWTENGNQVSTEASYTFTVDRNRTLVANFTENPSTIYTITVSANPNNGGSVSGGGTFNQMASCTVHATANSSYTFVYWTENGTQVSTNADYTFTVTGNRSLVAHFQQQQQQYTISVSANPNNGGNVSGGGTFNQGTSCTVHATANSGYTFVNWTENGTQESTNADYAFTVTGNRSLVAHFQQQQQQYTISASANPSNGGNVSGGGTFPTGSTCTVTATANTGFTFVNWTENGSVVCTNANYTITVDSDRTIVANFTKRPSDVINGIFTINGNNDHVYFSKGNLKYAKTTGVWSFMEHQYDMEESNNLNVGANYVYQKVISLFGWGTSGYNNHQPWSTSTSTSQYDAYNDPSSNLYDHSGYADWGVYNTINNSSQSWRTLTNEEWKYILTEREASNLNGVPNARYTKAKVNGVAGLILFPDNYSHPNELIDHIPSGINNTGINYSVNEYSRSEWSQMEVNGCVFLPAAGVRNGVTVSPNTVGEQGNYWSSTCHVDNTSFAYVLHFENSDLKANDKRAKYMGLCVRLVYPIQ